MMSGLARTSKLGPFQLGERLGVGGMAEVFVATAPSGVEVAIKRILPALAQDREFCEMFWDEARVTSQLVHPHVVRVLDYGRYEGELYIALELVSGPNLSRVLRKAAKERIEVDLRAVVSLGSQLLSALEFVHEAKDGSGKPLGIVHRDVSPGNVFLSNTGQVKLGDFGIVRSEIVARRTQPGELKGKMGYMSPEQSTGKAVDPRSDLFSAGIILAELLTLRPLFLGKNELDTLNRTAQVDLNTWHRFNGAVPLPLRAVVERALSRDRNDRYESAREMREAFLNAARLSGVFGEAQHLASWLEELGLIEGRGTERSGEQPIARAQVRPVPASSGSGEIERVSPLGLPTLRRGRELWNVEFTADSFPIQLFQALRRVNTGGVEISGSGRTLYLEVRSGRIVATHDSAGQEPLGRLLLEEAILDKSVIVSSIGESRRMGLRLGEYLVLERRLRESVLLRLLRTQIERRVASWLQGQSGRVVTLLAEDPRSVAAETDLFPESLAQVIPVIRQALSPVRLAQLLAPVQDAVLLPAPPGADLSSLALTAPEARVLLTTLDGGMMQGRSLRTVLETLVAERLARPQEAQFALFLGLCTGLIYASGFGRS